MGKKQIFTILLTAFCIVAIFLFGNIKQPQKSFVMQQQMQTKAIGLKELELEAFNKMNANQKQTIQTLKENLIKATADKQKADANQKIASFYQNEIDSEELTAYYTAEQIKLVNSQKNVKFAANFILSDVINFDGSAANRSFRADIAKGLFEKALITEPNNDSLKIGLAGCFMHGAKTDNPMIGTTMALDIIRKDSTNAFCQKMLGYGGLVSQQVDKALIRFEKSYELNPTDTSLAMRIAAIAKKWGNKNLANKYYITSKNLLAKNPQMLNLFTQEFENIK